MKTIASVLVVICLMAGWATAGYVQIRAVGNPSDIIVAGNGDVLTMQVSVSGFSDQVMETLALMNFDIAQQLNGDATTGAASNNYVNPALFDNFNNGTLINSSDTLIRNATASREMGTTFNTPGWAVNEVVVYTFTYTVGSPGQNGSIILSLSDSGNGVPMFGDVMGNDISGDVVVSNITIVPEPLTLALMGLGGLLIRKRM